MYTYFTLKVVKDEKLVKHFYRSHTFPNQRVIYLNKHHTRIPKYGNLVLNFLCA